MSGKPPILPGTLWRLPSIGATLFSNNKCYEDEGWDKSIILMRDVVALILEPPNSDDVVKVFVAGHEGWMNAGWFTNASRCAWEIKNK